MLFSKYFYISFILLFYNISLFCQVNNYIEVDLYPEKDIVRLQYNSSILSFEKYESFSLPSENLNLQNSIIKYRVLDNADTIFLFNGIINDSMRLGVIDFNRNNNFSDDHQYYYNINTVRKSNFLPSFLIPLNLKDSAAERIYFRPVFYKSENLKIGGIDSLLQQKYYMLLGQNDYNSGTFKINNSHYFIFLVRGSSYMKSKYAVYNAGNNKSINKDSIIRTMRFISTENSIIVDSHLISVENIPNILNRVRINYTDIQQAHRAALMGYFQGQYPPAFKKEDINGKNFFSADHKGKYILLDFWGTWCIPCIKVLPQIAEIHERYPKLQIVSIAWEMDSSGMKKIPSYIEKYKMNWINIVDVQGDEMENNVNALFDVTSYPTTILIDPEGKILHRGGSDEIPLLNELLKKVFEKKL